MKKRYRVILALISAILSTYLIFTLQDSPPEETDVVVYSAKQKIQENVMITSDMLTTKKIKSKNYINKMITNPEEIKNKWTNEVIYPGEIVRQEKLQSNQQITFQNNERKINIPVSLDRLGGFPNKGDYVDIIGYFPNDTTGISKTILTNVQIVQIYNQNGQIILAHQSKDEFENTNILPSIVTLKVSLEEANILSEALEIGSVRLLTKTKKRG